MADAASILAKKFAKMEYEKSLGAAGGNDIAGIPEANGAGDVVDWGTPNGWESFRARMGFYPYGMQNGTMVRPSNAAEAPPWAQTLMGGRTLAR